MNEILERLNDQMMTGRMFADVLDSNGLVVVPKEPTEKMYAAAEREWDGRMSARSAGVWKSMIEAAK